MARKPLDSNFLVNLVITITKESYIFLTPSIPYSPILLVATIWCSLVFYSFQITASELQLTRVSNSWSDLGKAP